MGRNYNHTRTVRTMRKIWQDRSHSLYSRFSLPLWSQKDLEISYLPWCKYVFPFYNTRGFILNNKRYCGTFLLILCIITIKTVELQRKKQTTTAQGWTCFEISIYTDNSSPDAHSKEEENQPSSAPELSTVGYKIYQKDYYSVYTMVVSGYYIIVGSESRVILK